MRLVILLEIIPLEFHLLCFALTLGAYHEAVLVKVTCTTAILVPLAIYTLLNGLRGLLYAKSVLTVVLLVVVVHSALSIWMYCQY